MPNSWVGSRSHPSIEIRSKADRLLRPRGWCRMLRFAQLEHEIRGKIGRVTLQLLVEALGLHSVQIWRGQDGAAPCARGLDEYLRREIRRK